MVAQARLQRAIGWYIAFALIAAVSSFFEIAVIGSMSAYMLIAAIVMVFVFCLGLIASIPILLPIAWLATDADRRPSPTMILLGALFAVIALHMGHRLYPTLEKELIPWLSGVVAVAGGIGGGIADVLSRRSGAPPSAETASGFLGFLRASGNPTTRSRVLVIGAVAGLAAFSWKDITSNPLYALIFEIAYTGQPIHLTTYYRCGIDRDQLRSSPDARRDLFRTKASFELADGKAIVLRFDNPCQKKYGVRSEYWKKRIRISLLDDATRPTELAIYDDASEQRPNASAPRLLDVSVLSADEKKREKVGWREVGLLVDNSYSFENSFADRARSSLEFATLRAWRLPKDQWINIPELQILANSPKPAFVADTYAKITIALGGYPRSALSWTYYDFHARQFATSAEVPAPGFVKGYLSKFHTKNCLFTEILKDISEEAYSNMNLHWCDGPVYYYDPSDQSLSMLYPSFFIYQPLPDAR